MRNAEAYGKHRVVELTLLRNWHADTFAEQSVLLPLEFSPCCPNCERPMVERRTRNLRNGSSFRWECAVSECRDIRIEVLELDRSGEHPRIGRIALGAAIDKPLMSRSSGTPSGQSEALELAAACGRRVWRGWVNR